MKIFRVFKIIKGGRIIFFLVLVVVGDGEGKIGLGLGKVNGVFDVIRKVIVVVKKNIVKIFLKNNIIFYEIVGKWGVIILWMVLVYEGIGVIVGFVLREILELVGVYDILIKIKGLRNKYNVVRVIVEVLKLFRIVE